MKLKVLIADKFPDLHIQQMKDLGCEVIYSPKLGENDIPEAAKDVDLIIVRSTIVNAAAINSGTNLKIIIRAGSGVNNIDLKAATEKGVYVTNCPGMNSIAVAELAMGLIISLDRRIPDNVTDFNKGVWNKGEYSKAEGLFGKTLGIIGTGAIGREVAKRAQAFGMKTLGKDVIKTEGAGITYVDDLKELLSQCDIITLHLPANAQTKGMFNKEVFSYLKPNTLLVNTSRADIIDEDALLEAIELKKIRAAVDVFKGEPEQKEGEVKSKLQGNKNIYVTHHIGASTEQAQTAVAEETVRIIKKYLDTGEIINCVNKK